jgi:hypothetical protein
MTVRDLLSAPSARSLLLGGGALAAVAAVALAPDPARPDEAPALALGAREPPAAAVHQVALEDEIAEPTPIDPLDSLQAMEAIADPADFTFTVYIGGTTYIRIASDAEVAVTADRDDAVLTNDDGIAVAIAPISAAGLPEELQRWKGRRVLVGGTCAATVIGFAEIGRISGDPRLARDGGDDDHPDPAGATWTAEAAFSHGSTMIAAELDRRCEGSWARAADRPAVGRAIAVADRRLEAAARRAFLASGHASAIAAGWSEAKQEGSWREHATLTASIVEHSITGARWAYVHAYKSGSCGEYGFDDAAIYQIADDGALTEIETRDSSGHDIEELVDLNGDGWFERIVRDEVPGGHSLVGPIDGAALESIHVPFLGCGC